MTREHRVGTVRVIGVGAHFVLVEIAPSRDRVVA